VSSVDCQPRALAFARAASSRAGWPGADLWSLELEDEDGPALGHDRRGFVDRVEAVLDAARIEVPACGDGDVLLAVDLEGGGNADGAGRQREAPQLVAGAGVERPELPILRPAGEQDVPAVTSSGAQRCALKLCCHTFLPVFRSQACSSPMWSSAPGPVRTDPKMSLTS